MGKRIEAILRPLGKHLSEKGYRRGNPISQEHAASWRQDDTVALTKASSVANARRFFAGHFRTLEGDAYRVVKRDEGYKVTYEGKARRGTDRRKELQAAAISYSDYLNRPNR